MLDFRGSSAGSFPEQRLIIEPTWNSLDAQVAGMFGIVWPTSKLSVEAL